MALLRLPDGGLRFIERSLQVARIHARDHLAGFDQVAFVGQDFADAGGVFGVDIDLVGFEPAIAEDDAGRQWRVKSLPPVIGPAGAAAQDGERHRDE